MDFHPRNQKFIILGILILVLGSMAGYKLLRGNDDRAVYEGTILSIQEENGVLGMLVDGSFTGGSMGKSGGSRTVTYYRLSSDAKIRENKKNIAKTELQVGQKIRLEGPGIFLTSYPAQGSADNVTLLQRISEDPVLRGKVLEVKEGQGDVVFSFLAQGELTGYSGDTPIWLTVKDTSYYPFSAPPGEPYLNPGDTVVAIITGGIMESYPLQAQASSVLVVPND